MPYDPAPAARVAYAAVRQLREEQGCRRGPVWNLLLLEERAWYLRHAERALMGLLPHQVQDAWRMDLTEFAPEEERWTVGPEIDHAKRTHPELDYWEALAEPYRRRFFVIQMNAVGFYVDIPAWSGDLPCVTAL
jgi:hypothetical protein